MNLLDFILRLAAALVFGSMIGVERQYHQRTAGLRTGALVSSGSALFVLVAALTPSDSSPLRIAPQIVTGVGFLCAGVIMRDGLHIRGLNTAGTLWCACGIGVLAGAGYYLPALAGTVMVLAANVVLRPLATLISNHAPEPAEVAVCYLLRLTVQTSQELLLRSLLLQELTGGAIGLQALQSSKDAQNPTQVEVCARLQCDGRQDQLLERIVGRLSLETGVNSVRWEVAPTEEGESLAKLALTSGAQTKGASSGDLPKQKGE